MSERSGCQPQLRQSHSVHAELTQRERRIEELGNDLGVGCIMHDTLPTFGEVREISIEEGIIHVPRPRCIYIRTVAGNDCPIRSHTTPTVVTRSSLLVSRPPMF